MGRPAEPDGAADWPRPEEGPAYPGIQHAEPRPRRARGLWSAVPRGAPQTSVPRAAKQPHFRI